MVPFSISSVDPHDVDEIRGIQKEVWLATYPNVEHGVSKEAIRARFASEENTSKWINGVKQALEAGESVGWKALVDNKIVGYSFAKKTDNKNSILSLYVLPQYHTQGIGKALMEKMMKWVDKTKPTVLEVAKYNTKAIDFYKSFGFQENGDIHNDEEARRTDIEIPEIEMIRPIIND